MCTNTNILLITIIMYALTGLSKINLARHQRKLYKRCRNKNYVGFFFFFAACKVGYKKVSKYMVFCFFIVWCPRPNQTKVCVCVLYRWTKNFMYSYVVYILLWCTNYFICYYVCASLKGYELTLLLI